MGGIALSERRILRGRRAPLPRSLKAAHTLFVVMLVPVYARQYGPGNFLWFSDVALLSSVPALVFESRRLASTQAVSVLVPELLWLIDLGAGIAVRRYPIGLASYMSDPRIPRFVRALSLFHLWLTPLLLLIVSRTGYDRRALRYQTMASAAVLLASWRLTKPADNVNWVHSLPQRIRSRPARAGFVAALAAGLFLACYLPAHLVLQRLFPARRP